MVSVLRFVLPQVLIIYPARETWRTNFTLQVHYER